MIHVHPIAHSTSSPGCVTGAQLMYSELNSRPFTLTGPAFFADLPNPVDGNTTAGKTNMPRSGHL